VDEAITVLTVSKARKVQHHIFPNKGRKRNYLKLPFAVEGFRTFFGRADFLGRFWGGTERAASPSDTDKSGSNKSSARTEARVTSLLPAEVEDTFRQQS
jgi:hypothetical protein